MICKYCGDTGMLIEFSSRFLDCAHCDAAQERVAFDAWCENEGFEKYRDSMFAAYQHGKEVALTKKE
jgi:hypothetical protein